MKYFVKIKFNGSEMTFKIKELKVFSFCIKYE